MKFVIKDGFGAVVGSVELPEDAELIFAPGYIVTLPTPNVRIPWRIEVAE